jgi:hypothetical protein
MTMRRRGKLSVNAQAMISPAIGDDTIELELTPEQLLELSQAAELAGEPVAPADIAAAAEPSRIFPAVSPLRPLFEPSPSSHNRRWHQTPIAKMAGATIVYIAFAWWSACQIAEQPHRPATVAARPTVVVIPPAAPLIAVPAQPAVQVTNPFDVTEVFEFPPGTSDAESREKVAQILLQRARERQSRLEHVKPAENLRIASLYRGR